MRGLLMIWEALRGRRGWFERDPACRTTRRLCYLPMPDITAYEAALCSTGFHLWNKPQDWDAKTLWECVPPGCGRHFTMWEHDTEDGVIVRTRQCFQMANFTPPNSEVWEGCGKSDYKTVYEPKFAPYVRPEPWWKP